MQAVGRGKYRNRRLADPVQVETLTPQQVRRVCTTDSVSALASDQQVEGADPAGLAWSAVCCTLMPYYNRAAVLTCAASLRGVGIWYRCGASRRCDTFQRGAGGVIVDCIGLVSAVVEWGKSQEKRL